MPVRVFLSLIDENVAFLYHPAGTVRVRVVAGDRLAKMTTVYDACSPHASLGSTVHNREADSSLEPHFDTQFYQVCILLPRTLLSDNAFCFCRRPSQH